MIKKPSIIITSIGRTGTKFFAELFANIMHETISLHEPDVFHFDIKKNKGFRFTIRQIQNSGFYNLFIKKNLGQWSLAKISDKRLKGRLDFYKAQKKLYEQRKNFVDNFCHEPCYVESNFGYYGLIDLLPYVFDQHKVLFIVRNAYNWIQSWVNWGSIYEKNLFRRVIGHNWPEADEFKEDPFRDNWSHMSNFEKLCWAWAKLNSYAIRCAGENPCSKLIHFEDIFESENRYENLNNLLDFVTTFQNGMKLDCEPIDGALETKLHSSNCKNLSFSGNQKKTFYQICGPLMEELGYRVN